MTDDKFTTEQEVFWAGDFGDDYIARNKGNRLLASNLNFFSKSLAATRYVKNCIEFGANIGMNLQALKLLNPDLEMHAIEINSTAADQLTKIIPRSNIYNSSILQFSDNRKWDLVIIKGVLIHINPDYLNTVYSKLVNATDKYLLIAEYYNPSPMKISYRGYDDRLFKRDFAGEIMDLYPNFKLVDYGFAYHRDVNFPQDDITWFLLKNDECVKDA